MMKNQHPDKTDQSSIDQLAAEQGIDPNRPDPEAGEVPVSTETKRKLLAALKVDPAARPAGSSKGKAGAHRGKAGAAACHIPAFLEDSRVWGISLQLYELRSARNWGIGDYQDLADAADLFGPLGADLIGLNPLHAPFLSDPERCSPYEPSNRLQLNPLYIAVDKVAGFRSDEPLERELDTLRTSELVDYAAVARTKLRVLRALWDGRGTETDMADFEAFVREEGKPLRLHALFEVISEEMSQKGLGAGWQGWPEAFRDPGSDAVAAFGKEHAEDIRFHMWLQWLAHGQLSEAGERARRAGMRIGLYLDLAVGEALDGAATWSEREAYIQAATIGSPPDPYATEGQDWHLAAFHPREIARGKSSPYRRMVTKAMRYSGAIRIDHVAALRRLYLVPLDSRPDGGAYVDYPQQALMRILAEASAEYESLVIGEDLGLLPEGLQDELAAARILSYRILSYEKTEDSFKPADSYPALALACISTHDHQTLAGWWRGADIRIRAEHNIVPPDVTEKHTEERKAERRELQEALAEAGTEPPERLPPRTASDEKLQPLVISAHRYIAQTPSMLAAVRLADVTNEKHPTNVPGTSDAYPNWKPKLSVSLDALATLPMLQTLTEAMRAERPRRE